MKISSQSKIWIIYFLMAGIFYVSAPVLEAAVDQASVEYHYQNGIKFYKRGLYEKAVHEFEKTLSLDPHHQEAKEYLDKVKATREEKKGVDAKKSPQPEIRKLYDEGTELYRKHDYEGAREVFNKILELKPVDEWASFYKERCEIFVARKLAREKKMEEKKQLKEKREHERLSRRKEREMKKLEREAILKQRVRINEERREARVKRVVKAKEEKAIEEKESIKEEKPAPSQEEKMQEKSRVKEEKIAAAGGRQSEKLKAKEERRTQKKEKIAQRQKEKEEKRAAAQERRNEKLKAKEERALRLEERKTKKEGVLKQREQVQQQKEEARQEHKNIKDLFVAGVEHYGRRQFKDAMASFEAVIEAESQQGEKTYTHAAQRMTDKAQRRLKEVQGQ